MPGYEGISIMPGHEGIKPEYKGISSEVLWYQCLRYDGIVVPRYEGI